MSRIPISDSLGASPIYETPPLGPAGQPAYLNAAISLEVRLAPATLLARLHAIEDELGRDRGPDAIRWGPRTIDLDLLFYGEDGATCIDAPDIVVPHPRAHERAFVMKPLAAIAPDLVHPHLGQTIAAITAALSDLDEVQKEPVSSNWPSGG